MVSILICSNSIAAPSKYFACFSDVAKKAFELGFSDDERNNIRLFDVFPIIRTKDNPYSCHNLVTLEDLEKEEYW